MVEAIRKELRRYASKKKAEVLKGFFKTGPGEYGEGDIFLGVCVPDIRRLVKKFKDINLNQTVLLLKSPIHEERLLALLILVLQYNQAGIPGKKRIYALYVNNTRFINNWDLVDCSAEHIVGAYLRKADKQPIHNLAKSDFLWERRISIMSTFHFIKYNEFVDSLRISKILLHDEEDLIHKAVGWMLREIGKRDIEAEEGFLRKYYTEMPRTMLRYSIEKFPQNKREKYLKGQV